jgi:DNA-binding transcriptional MerR regulator
MRIGELAASSGVSVRSLRYYETQGLLLSSRTSGGHREYSDAAVDRVILIQELMAAGLTSKVIVELLPCIYSGTTTPAMVQRLHYQREDIDRRARELLATRDRLDNIITDARHRLVA